MPVILLLLLRKCQCRFLLKLIPMGVTRLMLTPMGVTSMMQTPMGVLSAFLMKMRKRMMKSL
jgi:hypothetical protein